MATILLVDDDKDTWEAVRLALEPRVQIHPIGTLHSSLRFLGKRAHEISGVIVDLNLTDGSDFFGRELLERLREMNKPCVIFSSSIKSAEDGERYKNEFGVLGTVGKGAGGREDKSSLEQLRECVELMISVSIEQVRASIKEDLQKQFDKRKAVIETERRSSSNISAEAERVAGGRAARKLIENDSRRIKKLEEEAERNRDIILERISNARTVEELEAININLNRTEKTK